MKDNTEGMELVPDESFGRIYSASQLRALAERGAKQVEGTTDGYKIFVGPLELGRQFYISSKWLGGVADLLIEVDVGFARGGGKASRKLSTYGSTGEPSRGDEVLDPLQLGTDASGNPSVSVGGKPLSESALIDELVRPVKEAARLGQTPARH